MHWIELLLGMDADELKQLFLQTHPSCISGLPRAVAVVGTSHIGEGICSALLAAGVVIKGLFDDALERLGTVVSGMQVHPTTELASIDRSLPVILATHRLDGLTRRLRSMGFKSIWPFALLSIRWPDRFHSHPFYAGLHDDLINHRGRLLRLVDTLADDMSREILDRVVGFRMTLDVSLIEPYVKPLAYFSPEVLSFSGQETMIDGGAFNGDSIREFIKITNGSYRSIICFEPSQGSYAQLMSEFQGVRGVRCVQACLYERDAQLRFDNTDARDAAIACSGTVCPAMCVDNLPEANEISFIKLNIEGAEESALRGARQTIQRNVPKLAVAAYHRPRDLWFLPGLLQEMQPDYRLYFRQHSGGTVETVMYATTDDSDNAEHRGKPVCASC